MRYINPHLPLPLPSVKWIHFDHMGIWWHMGFTTTDARWYAYIRQPRHILVKRKQLLSSSDAADTQDSCSASGGLPRQPTAGGLMQPQWGWLASCSIKFRVLHLSTAAGHSLRLPSRLVLWCTTFNSAKTCHLRTRLSEFYNCSKLYMKQGATAMAGPSRPWYEGMTAIYMVATTWGLGVRTPKIWTDPQFLRSFSFWWIEVIM